MIARFTTRGTSWCFERNGTDSNDKVMCCLSPGVTYAVKAQIALGSNSPQKDISIRKERWRKLVASNDGNSYSGLGDHCSGLAKVQVLHKLYHRIYYSDLHKCGYYNKAYIYFVAFA